MAVRLSVCALLQSEVAPLGGLKSLFKRRTRFWGARRILHIIFDILLCVRVANTIIAFPQSEPRVQRRFSVMVSYGPNPLQRRV